MRKIKISVFLILLINTLLMAQDKKPEDYGFRHFKTTYLNDMVDIILLSKKGEEKMNKPLFLFIQGSLPQPLIKYYDKRIYMVFPFKTDSLLGDYHLAIISKPYVPLVYDFNKLKENATYVDTTTGKFPKKYLSRNYLDYYAKRNKTVLEFFKKQSFINKGKIVVAGHSEGSTIAARLALISKDVTHLIYASGNPFGRIMSIIGNLRAEETLKDTSTEMVFNTWRKTVNNPEDLDDTYGDPSKTLYSFSIPPIQYLEKLKIPVLVCYGTKDYGALFNDYLRVDIMKRRKSNFTFMPYVGFDHNFFAVKPNGETDYDQYNWDNVASDWLKWLHKQ